MQRKLNAAALWSLAAVLVHITHGLALLCACMCVNGRRQCVSCPLLSVPPCTPQLIYDPVCAQFGSALHVSPSCRKVASTATPPSSSRRWSLSRAPFTRRRRGWPRTAPEITARIRSLWVTRSSAQADKPARHHITSHHRAPPVTPLRSTLVICFWFIIICRIIHKSSLQDSLKTERQSLAWMA